MNELKRKNTQLLINSILEKGHDYAINYLENLFNENLKNFNDFVKECKKSSPEAYGQGTHTILKFNVKKVDLGVNIICIDYNFKNSKFGENVYSTTHAYIDLENENRFKFFQFGPDVKVNKKHQEWLDKHLEREYKFMQLGLK